MPPVGEIFFGESFCPVKKLSHWPHVYTRFSRRLVFNKLLYLVFDVATVILRSCTLGPARSCVRWSCRLLSRRPTPLWTALRPARSHGSRDPYRWDCHLQFCYRRRPMRRTLWSRTACSDHTSRDCTPPTTGLAKLNSAKFLFQYKVWTLGEILSSENFMLYGIFCWYSLYWDIR